MFVSKDPEHWRTTDMYRWCSKVGLKLQGGPNEKYSHFCFQKKKITGKIVFVHFMKKYKGTRFMAPLILTLSTGWR